MYVSHFTTCRRWVDWSTLATPHKHYNVMGYDCNSLYNVKIIGDYPR